MEDDLYFPEEISEEDLQLWLKELNLTGNFRSFHPALAQEDGLDRWELDTGEWTAVYEKDGDSWRRVGEPRYWAGLFETGRAAADYIRAKLKQPSFTEMIFTSKVVHDEEE